MKRMYKVISPIKRGDGSTYWMRVGTAHTNRDDSINIYLDALPLTRDGKDVMIQLRELTEEDFRKASERRAAPDATHPVSTNPDHAAAASADVPF